MPIVEARRQILQFTCPSEKTFSDQVVPASHLELIPCSLCCYLTWAFLNIPLISTYPTHARSTLSSQNTHTPFASCCNSSYFRKTRTWLLRTLTPDHAKNDFRVFVSTTFLHHLKTSPITQRRVTYTTDFQFSVDLNTPKTANNVRRVPTRIKKAHAPRSWVFTDR